MDRDSNVSLLITGCRQGSAASQFALYQHFFSYGMGVCLPYAKNREIAKEMLNDGFLKVFAKIDHYDSSFPFKPWLRKVLVRSAIDYYRKYHLKDGQKLAPTTTDSTIHNEALDTLEYEDLLKIMQALPMAYRMVFNLYVVEGLSHAEIAKELNISIGSSKSNLFKARQKIKELLVEFNDIHTKSKKYG